MIFFESVQQPQNKGTAEMQMFSINAASLLLERDRRTVTKAMFGVPPDGKEKKQSRWKMSTIVDALERHNRANDSGNSGDAYANPPEYAAYDAAFAALEALPTLPARRKAAIKIMPVLHAMIAALTAHGREVGQHPEHIQLRGDAVYRISMLGFQSPCAWSHDEVWKNLNSVGFDEDGNPI
jgi:hypothetical protein